MPQLPGMHLPYSHEAIERGGRHLSTLGVKRHTRHHLGGPGQGLVQARRPIFPGDRFGKTVRGFIGSRLDNPARETINPLAVRSRAGVSGYLLWCESIMQSASSGESGATDRESRKIQIAVDNQACSERLDLIRPRARRWM